MSFTGFSITLTSWFDVFGRDEGMRPLFHIHGKLGLLNGSAENVVEAVLYGHDVKISGNPPKAIDALSYNVNTTQAFGATVWTLDWKGHTLENYDGNFNYAGFVKVRRPKIMLTS